MVIFGHYIPWDGQHNAEVAKNGFNAENLVEGSIVDYEKLDNYQTGIHDYFKFLKFGFGRATDLACCSKKRSYIKRRS